MLHSRTSLATASRTLLLTPTHGTATRTRRTVTLSHDALPSSWPSSSVDGEISMSFSAARRADDLRSYAGDTALPGGKRDPGDKSPEDTARREAFEEIGLPKDRRRIPLLCTLEPFLSTNNLIVFPVVVLVTDPAIKPVLNAPEVAALFSHPLASLLSSDPPIPLSSPSEYHTFNDIEWGQPPTSRVRIHKFLTGREPDIKPLFGLTAAILLRVAVVGYAQDIEPDFAIEAPTQLPMKERIWYAMTTVPSLVEACRKEGIKPKRPPGQRDRHDLPLIAKL